MELTDEELTTLLQAVTVAELYYRDPNARIEGMFYPAPPAVREIRIALFAQIGERLDRLADKRLAARKRG